MKIVLLKDVSGVGKKGQIVDVADGYAKNFLIARKLGSPATANVQAGIVKENAEAKARELKLQKHAQELKNKIEKRTFTISVKVGDKGQVFGGVHEQDIAAAINSQLGSDLERNQIHLSEPVKQLGDFTASAKLQPGVSATVRFSVIAA